MENCKADNNGTKTTDSSTNENPNNNSPSLVQEQEHEGSNSIVNQSTQSSSARTPFTNLSQVDADLALARTLQEQERAYMMLRLNGDGSDYGSWEAGSYVHEDDDDFDDPSEDEYDDEVEFLSSISRLRYFSLFLACESIPPISKKCLDSVFTLVSKDVSLESPIGSIELSLISEIFEDHQLGESAEVNSNFTSQSNLTFSSAYFLMSAKRTVLGVQPGLTSKKSRIQEDYIYLLYFHEEGPVGYAMYRIDVGAFSIDENASNNAVAISPVLELPRAHYPTSMAAFAVGSRIFLIGGEIGIDIGGEIGIDDDDYYDRDKPTVRLSEMVYVCNTASALPLSVLQGTPMNGGTKFPIIIPVNEMIYVISELPTLYTYLDEDTTLFEVFDPNANEGKGKWSSLSNPPFYPSSCDDYGCGAWSWSHVSRIVSHAVVECKIFFCTTRKDHMYAFDVNCNTWERFDIYNPIGEVHFPFRDGAMLISDKSWAATGAYSESPVCTYDLTAEFGFVRKNVEDLEAITSPAYYVMDYQLLDLSNGWYCLLQFGTNDEHFRRGNQYIFASVLRLVKKRMDAVFFNDVYPWPCHCKPLTKDSCDVEKSIGQIEVFGATDLHNSLFSIGAKSFMTDLVACFPIC